MGDGEKAPLRLQFNPKIRLECHGSTITSDAGLLAFREFDDALGLTEIAEDYLQDRRTGRNILHHLVPLLRQSIFSRLAGYDDTNDADRLAYDPAMRVVVGWQGSERKAGSTSEMERFETETLTEEKNLKGLARMNSQWVEGAMVHTPHRSLEQWQMGVKDLRRRMILAPTPQEGERWYAILLLAQGLTAAATAEALERAPHTIGRWASAFGEGGPAALIFEQTGGSPPPSTRRSRRS